MTLIFPAQPHGQTHFTGSEFVRDIVIGMSDGLACVSGGVAASAAFLIAQALG